jgi:hypothetical protein
MDDPTPYVLRHTDVIAPVVALAQGTASPHALGKEKDGSLVEKRASDVLGDDDKRESSPNELEQGVHAGISNIPWKWKALALVTAITCSSGQECALPRLCSTCHRATPSDSVCRSRRDRLGSRPAQEHPA